LAKKLRKVHLTHTLCKIPKTYYFYEVLGDLGTEDYFISFSNPFVQPLTGQDPCFTFWVQKVDPRTQQVVSKEPF